MGKKKTKHAVVNYDFPCPSRFLHSLSSSALPDVDVDVGSSKNSSSSSDVEFIESSDSSMMWSDLSDDDDDDVRPSKIRKLSESESSNSSSDDYYYSDVENYYVRPDIEMLDWGEKLDLISYLSSKSRDFLVDKSGRKVRVKSAIQGKYVILICLKLPVKSCSFEGMMCWAIRSACSTSSIWSANVQVVLVPIVRVSSQKEKEKEKEHLASFLSGLPSCLAIPLWDSNFARRFDDRTVIFDPSHTVLQNAFCSYHIVYYGADSYPFTFERFCTLDKTNRRLLREKPFPLDRLLGLDLSDSLSNVAGDAQITVSQLKQKLVGVYLVFNFRIFDAVHRAYQDCLAKGRELEIVLACINLEDHPQHYMDSVYAALRDSDKGKGILSSWWVLPYNDTIQRRLWMLVDYLCVGDDEPIEELIIVGPRGEYVDPLTLCAISYDPSIHDMYPYAIHPVARQETARLQKLTLESLLISNHNDYLVTQQGNLMPVTELRGKNVLLFIADFEEGYHRIMDQMRDYWCPEIKLKCKALNTALVFVPLHATGLIFTKDLDPEMFWLWDPIISWLISPPNHAREALIVKALSLKGLNFMRSDQLSCVAFGEDGRFVSNDLYNLSEFMANDLPPDHFYTNILEQFCHIFNKDIRERSLVRY